MVRHTKSLLLVICVLAIAVGGGYLVEHYRQIPVADVSAPTSPVRAGVPEPRFHTLPARLSLLAGDGVAGFREGHAARFADPWGVVVAPDGRIIVADAGSNDRIRSIDAQGNVSVLAGAGSGYADGPANIARFDTPSGLAIDDAGRIYVADTGNHAIRRIATDGTVTTLAGGKGSGDEDGPVANARFNGPVGVAVDAQGNVYVADTYNHRIRRIGTDGMVTTVAGSVPGFQDGTATQARFDTPCAVAIDPDGSLWVADTVNFAIRHIAGDGGVTTLVRSDPKDRDAPLRHPLGIVADKDALYVTEASHGALLRYAHDGGLTVVTGSSDAQRMSRPAGVALANPGLIVADAAAARVYRVDDSPGVPAPVGPAPDAPLPVTHGRWPEAPQDGWHEIVGVAGEVRGNDKGESRDHLHLGVDVRADVGARVLAIADGKVSDPLPTWGYGKLHEGLALDGLDYIHMRVGRDASGRVVDASRFRLLPGDDGKPGRVEVRRGTHFRAGDVLGTVNAMAHTHLQLDGNLASRNPIDLGFTGFTDHIAPVIDRVELRDPAGKALKRGKEGITIARTAGPIDIVVEAWDHVDDNLPRRRLGLYALGYQLLDDQGKPLPGFGKPRMNLVFDRLPADDEATRVIYAPDSGETVHGAARTRFLYMVTNVLREGVAREGHWDVSALSPGRYTLHIVAADRTGNQATRNANVPLIVQ